MFGFLDTYSFIHYARWLHHDKKAFDTDNTTA